MTAQQLELEGGALSFTLEPLSGRYILVTDSGLLQINAGLNDAWLNFGTIGQGFFITVFPSLKLIFLSWFTFDTERPDESIAAILGEPGHRWVTAIGSYAGNSTVLDIEVTSGGVFDSPNPAPTQVRGGTIRIEFHGCNSATLHYEINPPPLSGVIELQRLSPDNVTLCQALDPG